MRPAFAPLILEQLVHDTPFAWYLWSLAALSPVLRAGDLAELDRRLEAYLDVAEIAGADARSPSAADRGALFVRTVLALRTGDREALGHALVDLQRPAQVDELADALVRVGKRGAAAIPMLLDDPAPLVRAAALHGARRCHLRLDERLGAHLADPHPRVLAAALRLVGDTRRRAFLPCVTPHLGHPDDAVRYQAARAGVLLDAPAAAAALEAFLYGISPYLREALLLRYAGAFAADLTGVPERIARSALPVAVRIAHLATFGLADTISRCRVRSVRCRPSGIACSLTQHAKRAELSAFCGAL